jgi:4-hydroxy-3-methylbut-2-enyl diphosphate reductase
VAAISVGILAFILIASMIITGLSYNLHVLPLRREGQRVYGRIRDIPGSKTILIAVAWGVVTALLSALSEIKTLNIGTILVFLWSVGIVFARTVFYDILDMQEDRIVGKETLPILLGAKRSLKLLKGVLAATFFILISSAVLGEVTKLGYLLTLCPLFLFGVVEAHERGKVQPSARLEFQIETVFIIAGFITLIWSIFMATG